MTKHSPSEIEVASPSLRDRLETEFSEAHHARTLEVWTHFSDLGEAGLLASPIAVYAAMGALALPGAIRDTISSLRSPK